MKLKFWLSLGAFIQLVFGVALVAATGWMGTTYGMDLNDEAMLMARLVGAAFLFAAFAQWGARNSPASDAAVSGILFGAIAGNIIGFVFTLMATLNGPMNSMGWLPVVLYAIFALVFSYFLFLKPRS